MEKSGLQLDRIAPQVLLGMRRGRRKVLHHVLGSDVWVMSVGEFPVVGTHVLGVLVL